MNIIVTVAFYSLATKESEELSASFMALYDNLHCDEENRENIKSEIEAVVDVFLEEIPCAQRGTCNVSDVNILNCGKESTRKKRSVEEKQITAGFNVKFMCSTIQCMSGNFNNEF